MEVIRRKRQHIVPEFYLKGFCDEKGQLSVYDLGNHKYFLASPDKICVEKYAYETKWENANPQLGKYVQPNSIEIAFSEKETQYKKLLDVLLNSCMNARENKHLVCKTDEKLMLAELVANFLLRDPDVFHGIIQTNYPIDELKKLDLYDHTNELFEKLGWGSPDSFISHAIKKGLFETSINGSPAQKAVDQLLSMNLVFYRCSGPFFITSSRLVMLFDVNNKGDEKVGSAVFFPLSPSVLLMYTDLPQYRKNRNRLEEISSIYVKQFNHHFLTPRTGSVKFLIARDKKDFDGLAINN